MIQNHSIIDMIYCECFLKSTSKDEDVNYGDSSMMYFASQANFPSIISFTNS